MVLTVGDQLDLDGLHSGTLGVVVEERAGDGIEVLHAGDELLHGLGVGAHVLHGLEEDLEGVVHGSAHHVGLDAELLAVVLDVGLGLLVLVVTVHVGGDVHAVGILLGDVQQHPGIGALGAQHGDVQALHAHLTEDLSGLLIVVDGVDEVRTGGAGGGDHGGEVAVLDGHALLIDHLHVGIILFELGLEGVDLGGAEIEVHIDDGDLGGLQLLGGDHGSAGGLDRAGEGLGEDEITGAGHIGMDGVGGDHQLARFLEDGGSHLGGAGIGTGDHSGDVPIARKTLGDVGGLGGVEAIIEVDQLHLGAVDAAVLVAELDGELGGIQSGRAVSGRGSGGNGSEETDLDGVRLGLRHADQRDHHEQYQCE